MPIAKRCLQQDDAGNQQGAEQIATTPHRYFERQLLVSDFKRPLPARASFDNLEELASPVWGGMRHAAVNSEESEDEVHPGAAFAGPPCARPLGVAK
jgi:hypothetical protein